MFMRFADCSQVLAHAVRVNRPPFRQPAYVDLNSVGFRRESTPACLSTEFKEKVPFPTIIAHSTLVHVSKTAGHSEFRRFGRAEAFSPKGESL